MSTIKVSKILPLGTDSTKTITIGSFSNGDTIRGPGSNTPFVLAMNSSTQSLANGTITQIVFDTEVVDTADEFSSNRWTCGTAGRYFFNCTMELQSMNNEIENWMKIYKNGSAMTPTFTLVSAKSSAAYFNCISIMINAAANDYFEIYTQQNNGNARNILAESAVWSIVKVIE